MDHEFSFSGYGNEYGDWLLMVFAFTNYKIYRLLVIGFHREIFYNFTY